MHKIYDEVLKERERQDRKFGEQNHSPIEYCAILGEEIGEANQAIVDAHFEYKPLLPTIIEFRKELIDIAAVAHQIIESVCRQNKTEHDLSIVFKDVSHLILECEKSILDIPGSETKKLLTASVMINIPAGEMVELAMHYGDDVKELPFQDFCGLSFSIVIPCMAAISVVDKMYPEQA